MQYKVVQFKSLAEMERYLNVEGSEYQVVGFQILELPTQVHNYQSIHQVIQNEYILILDRKKSNANP